MNGLAKFTMVIIPWSSLVAQWQRTHLECRRRGFDPRVRKIPWKRKQQPTPVFLPGKISWPRSLAGYNPLGCKIVRRDLVTKQQIQQIISWYTHVSNYYIVHLEFTQLYMSIMSQYSWKKNIRLCFCAFSFFFFSYIFVKYLLGWFP